MRVSAIEPPTPLAYARHGRARASGGARLSDLVTADSPDVLEIREKYGLSQAKFAALLGTRVDTL